MKLKLVTLSIALLGLVACSTNDKKSTTSQAAKKVDLKKEFNHEKMSNLVAKMEKEMIDQGLKNIIKYKKGADRGKAFNLMVYGLRSYLNIPFPITDIDSKQNYIMSPNGDSLSFSLISQNINDRKVRLKSQWTGTEFARTFGVRDCQLMDCSKVPGYISLSDYEKLIEVKNVQTIKMSL